MSDLAVVLGASGGIGSAVVAELVRQGTPTRAVSRHARTDAVPPGVQALAADVATPSGAADAVRGATVVYHCVQPAYTRWTQEFPTLTAAITAATTAVAAKLVVADNLYMYFPVEGPLTEQSPQRPPHRKGRVRAEMADNLLAANDAGRLAVVLGRASDYFGPGGTHSVLGTTLFWRVVAGRRPQWIGRLDQLHTLHYLPDLARALVLLGTRADANGRAWHLPAAPAITGAALFDQLSTAVGWQIRPSVASRRMLRVAGLVMPMAQELAETCYQWEQPFVSDASAFEATFGPFPVTSLADALSATVSWWQAGSPAG